MDWLTQPCPQPRARSTELALRRQQELTKPPGTFDFSPEEAMSEKETQRSLEVGAERVDQLDCDLFIAGEMGIGNTTSASAIIAALLNKSAEQVVGRGTGIDDTTRLNKQRVIETALFLHSKQLGEESGAAVAVSLVRSALLLHNNMATFSEASVSGSNS